MSGNGPATGKGKASGLANAPSTSVGTQRAATNTSVSGRAAALGALASERERAQSIGTLRAVVEDGRPMWEAVHSATGHRLTEISDASNSWMVAHDPLGRVTSAVDKDFVYDPLGRLVVVRVNGQVAESYLLEGDGRLFRVNRHDASGYSPSVFMYEGEQMVSAWTGSETGTEWSQEWQAVWGEA